MQKVAQLVLVISLLCLLPALALGGGSLAAGANRLPSSLPSLPFSVFLFVFFFRSAICRPASGGRLPVGSLLLGSVMAPGSPGNAIKGTGAGKGGG